MTNCVDVDKTVGRLMARAFRLGVELNGEGAGLFKDAMDDLLQIAAERDALVKVLRRHHESSQLRGGSSVLYLRHLNEEWGIGHETAKLLEMYEEKEDSNGS